MDARAVGIGIEIRGVVENGVREPGAASPGNVHVIEVAGVHRALGARARPFERDLKEPRVGLLDPFAVRVEDDVELTGQPEAIEGAMEEAIDQTGWVTHPVLAESPGKVNVAQRDLAARSSAVAVLTVPLVSCTPSFACGQYDHTP